jgi:hypothetical protein
MANNIAFQAKGKTTRLNVSNVANTVVILADNPSNQLRIHNGTAVEVFVHINTTGTENAAVPVAGTPAYGWVLHNNSTVVFTVPGQATDANTCYVSAIVNTGTANVFITPGEGL